MTATPSKEMATLGLIVSSCAQGTMERFSEFEDYTPDEELAIRQALVTPLRALIVRKEFNRMKDAGDKVDAILELLSERYGISYETAYSITHNRRCS